MASMNFHRRKPAFLDRSLRWRKQAFITIKNQIRRDAPILGGQFTTHDYLHGQNGWIDAYFLGRRSPVFYNLDLQTTRHAYKEAVWHRSRQESSARVPDNEPSVIDRAVKDPKTGRYITPAREPVRHPDFDGMSRLEWVRAQLPSIADSKAIGVREEWSIHDDYGYGIGLHATIDVPYLTIDAVNAFIHRFLQTETDYQSPTVLSYAYKDIKHWGLESNAVIDPLDWAEAERQAQVLRQEDRLPR